MSNVTLNQGLFLNETSYSNQGSHLDGYAMRNQLKTTGPHDMGPIEIWAMAQKIQAPLYTMASFGGKNTVTLDDLQGRYKWKLPIVNDLPFIVKDINSSDTTKGKDGLPFQILINKRAFGNGEIISMDKFNGQEMIVTSDPIIKAGDGYVYTVKLISNDNTSYLSNTTLAGQPKVFSTGSAMGDYGQVYNDLGVTSGGFREYFNFIGQAWASQSISVDGPADAMARGYIRANGAEAVTEVWKILDPNIDPSISNLKSLKDVLGGDKGLMKALGEGRLAMSYVTAMEAACLKKIAQDIENQCMWGKGGKVNLMDGATDIRLSVGLWKQLDYGYKRVYNKSNFTLDLFKGEIFNFYNGRIDFQGPESNKKLVVQTGMGGMKMVNEAIKQYAVNSGLVINASEIGAITGKGMDLGFGYSYTSFNIPFLANVRFVLNPAFDNVYANELENPIIDGFRLSSYSFIIFDVTDNAADNIVLLQHPDNQMKWFYINGDTDYMGRNGHAASGSFSGYKVNMKQRHKGVWVKDPTKVLKIVMKSPINGKSL